MVTRAELPDLPEGYSLTNFETVLDWVEARCGALLTDEERDWVLRFRGCSLEGRRLYIRLAYRRGPYFDIAALSYPEIPDVPATVDELVRAGLATRNPPLTVEDVAAMMTKAELAERLGSPGQAKLKKAALLATLSERHGQGDVRETAGLDVVHVDDAAWRHRLTVLFFGNAYQGLHEFILTDLGLAKYEGYAIDPAARTFTTRSQLEACLELHRIEDVLWGRSKVPRGELDELLTTVPGPQRPGSALERQRHGVLNSLARRLERVDAFEEALRVYAQSEKPPARERRARLLAKEEGAAAVALVDEIAEAPRDESERAFVRSFGWRLRKKRGLEFEAPPKRAPPPVAPWTLSNDGRRVEVQTADAYAAQGWEPHYVENLLFMAIWGLVFWEEMFAPDAAAFVHPFQRAPHDLFTPRFRERSASALASRMRWLQKAPRAELSATVGSRYDDKRATANAMVKWSRIERDLIVEAVEIIPRTHLVGILGRMTFDLSHNRSGLPDLVLLDRPGGRYRLVEVKSPGDRLHPGQRAWFDFFDELEIPCEVAQVSWASSDTPA